MVEIKKKGDAYWVTFRFTPSDPDMPVKLKGEWDNWDCKTMLKKKNGELYLRKKFRSGSWQFGYLMDGLWVTDSDCNAVISPFGSHNSLLTVGDENDTCKNK